MEITMFVVYGFIGGFALALLLFGLNRRRDTAPASPDAFRNQPLSTDVINMARIRVAGVGGLGMLAMAVVVAFTVPRIGESLAIGLGLGGVLAVVLIAFRRRTGPMPSRGKSAGANTTLSIDK
jgi:hypothetical protein